MQYGAIEPRCLNGILPTMRYQRATHEYNVDQSIKQAQLAQRIEQIDLGFIAHGFTGTALRNGELGLA